MKITVENDNDDVRQAVQRGIKEFNHPFLGSYQSIPVRIAIRV